MEIMPNSTIKFLRNIPFDNDYNDTIYFDNPNQQYNYFSGNEFFKYELSNQYYTRHSAGVINVELPLGSGYDPITHEEYKISTAESLFDCNYIMFCNESFRYIDQEDGFRKKKWFYAFITDIEYVNNQVARVTFEIDAMQTWMFDYELEQCYIEREHSETDKIGDNIISENLDIGDTYMTTNITNHLATKDDMQAVVLVSKTYDAQEGKYIYPIIYLNHNIPTTLWIKKFNISEELTEMWNFLSDYILETGNKLTPDEIVTIYLFPDNSFWGFDKIVTINRPTDFIYSVSDNHRGDFYVPRNNKLYTYPYTALEVSNHEGTSQLYHFEYFTPHTSSSTTGVARFKINGCDAPSPALVAQPIGYLPTEPYSLYSLDQSNNGYDYGITISDFQQCAWVGDAFKAWWAQNKNSFVTSSQMSVLAGGATAVAGAITENPYLVGMGVASAFSGVLNNMAKKEDIKNQPPSIYGLSNSISLPISFNYFGYSFRTKQITGQMAETIDSYFSMFGYATHRVKTPNRNVRQRWTYTQTVGCTLKGKLPSKYQKQICKIYDKGIRFWNKDVQVGEYRNPSTGGLYENKCLAEQE